MFENRFIFIILINYKLIWNSQRYVFDSRVVKRVNLKMHRLDHAGSKPAGFYENLMYIFCKTYVASKVQWLNEEDSLKKLENLSLNKINRPSASFLATSDVCFRD